MAALLHVQLQKLNRSTNKLYVCGQISGWGAFLVLRLIFTAIYCAKLSEVSLAYALAVETFAHLGCAAWSHVVWLWLNRRRLVERGWRRITAEGFSIASLGVAVVLLLTWGPYRALYAEDFARFGTATMFWGLVLQNALITALWFYSLVALLFFDRVGRLELERAEARATAREAQLHALRGQVNPHFLFNSFNSLRALIALDPARATEALTQLSGLLRYSLTSADRLVVPLGEELQVVQRFLELEKLRLGPRLSVVAEVPSRLDGAVVPTMLLQGLVENAVKFGPADRKAGGEVAYSVALAGDRLHLRVTNPGRLATSSDSTALGLRNLRERLHLLYGDAASFSLREEPGDLVVAEASLPVRPPETARPGPRSAT